MIYFVKLVFYLLRELVFDNKDEYDIKSTKFNTRKFILLLLMVMTVLCNFWLFYRLVVVSMDYKESMTHCQPIPELEEVAPTKTPVTVIKKN